MTGRLIMVRKLMMAKYFTNKTCAKACAAGNDGKNLTYEIFPSPGGYYGDCMCWGTFGDTDHPDHAPSKFQCGGSRPNTVGTG